MALALCKKPLWWQGPDFLHDREYEFINKNLCLPESDDIPELKCGSASSEEVVLLTQTQTDFYKFFDRYSDINKFTRVVAYLLRFYNNIKNKNSRLQNNYLSSSELQKALHFIIKHEQEVYFMEEINSLNKNLDIKSNLKAVHPFIGSEGLLQVGGRLQKSDLPYMQKHLIILPRDSKITNLIIHRERLCTPVLSYFCLALIRYYI